MTKTYDDIDHKLNDGVMQNHLDPVDVAEETRAYLESLNIHDALGVCRFAEGLSDAIAYEHAIDDEDGVMTRMTAMLTELVGWLDRNDIDANELLTRRKLTPEFERQLERL